MIGQPVILFALFILLLGLISLALALSSLARAVKNLKSDTLALAKTVVRQQNDMAGLCSAAIVIDERLIEHDGHLSRLVADIEAANGQREANRSYYLAIDKIKKGANVEELVSECGLSLAEAALLLRLHGAGDLDSRKSSP